MTDLRGHSIAIAYSGRIFSRVRAVSAGERSLLVGSGQGTGSYCPGGGGGLDATASGIGRRGWE